MIAKPPLPRYLKDRVAHLQQLQNEADEAFGPEGAPSDYPLESSNGTTITVRDFAELLAANARSYATAR